MFSRNSRLVDGALSALFVVLVSLFPVFAQGDPDPNSPTPVLLSAEGSTRALAVTKNRFGRASLSKVRERAFAPGNRVVLFVTNIDLMDGEGANAFRMYAEDAKGRKYRFPVLDLQPSGQEGVYSLTIQLRDEIGFWEQPTPNGDLLLRVSWRGLGSNRVKLGFGKMGGPIKDDKGAVPTPLSQINAKSPSFSKTQTFSFSKEEEPPSEDYVGYIFSGDRTRFLEQAAFGPSTTLDNELRRRGLRIWLGMQFEEPYPSANNPYPDIPLKSTDQGNVTLGCGMFPNPSPEYSACIRDHYTMYPVQKWFWKETFYGKPQLHHRVAWALQQMWVISGVDTQQSSWMIAYHKVISENAFGNYRDLMYDTTLNPGMGNYLDMARSTRNNPNENYPREILQLFTIGLFMLNQDGTLQVDGSGNPIPTYDQNTINNLTKVFTGWSFCNVGCANSAPGIVNYKDPMILINQGANHDLTAKTLLTYPGSTTTNIPACTGCTGTARETYAWNSLNQTLDNIFYHPSLAPYVSKYLIQHLVTSDPTPAYVGRVSAVFNNNGVGVRGDIKAVVRAILLDPEARGDAKTDPNFGKLREPVQLITNIARHFNVRGAVVTGGGFAPQSDGVVNGASANLGQSVFNSPTVFNYYPPGYIVPGAAILGPEFAIMTTGTSIGRANLGNTLVYNQVNVALPNTPEGTSLNLAEMQSLVAADPTNNLLLDTLNKRMMHGTMSPEMRSTIMTAVNSIAISNPPTLAETLARARQAIYLVATSSQYQIQR